MEEKFLIYSKVGCVFCEKLAHFMEQNGIEYTKLTLDEDYTRDEFLNKFGQSTFPRVLHGEELIGGMKEAVKYLAKNGYVTK